MPLTDVLKSVGKPTELYRSPDGSEVLVLPYGGRVLGLFAPGSKENYYWTHPALGSVDTARAFYEGNQWHNSGGDRTWLAPEIDIFFPEFPALDKFWEPRELDPGQYQVTRTGGTLRLVNRLACTLSRTKRTVQLQISKSVSGAPHPLRYERSAKRLLELEYAGYTQHAAMDILPDGNDHPPDRVGLWNLVQMPHGGDLLIPTHGKTEPRVFFGTVAPEDLVVNDHLIRYRMHASGLQKIALRAAATAGRVGYLYPAGDQWALIIRNFFINPSGEYIDVPCNDTEDLGYSTQACNVNNHLGSFSELEYHVPAIGGGTGDGTGLIHCDDWSQVWAFRGPREPIVEVARALLSADVERIQCSRS